MKKTFLILALVTSTANAGLEKSPIDMYDISNLRNTTSKVSIIRAKNVLQTCEQESIRRGYGGFKGLAMEACSFHDSKECTIVTGYKTNNDILGHELHHCFAGDFH